MHMEGQKFLGYGTSYERGLHMGVVYLSDFGFSRRVRPDAGPGREGIDEVILLRRGQIIPPRQESSSAALNRAIARAWLRIWDDNPVP